MSDLQQENAFLKIYLKLALYELEKLTTNLKAALLCVLLLGSILSILIMVELLK